MGKMKFIGEPIFCDCQHTVVPVLEQSKKGPFGALPYCLTKNGERLCWDCCDEKQKEDLKEAQDFSAYLSLDGKRIETFTGGVLAHITTLVRERRMFVGHTYAPHNICYWRALDVHGQRWYGRGETGMSTRMRRVR